MESRKLEDTIRDWGDRYGEKFTDTELSRENRCLERADRGLPQRLVRRKWYQYRHPGTQGSRYPDLSLPLRAPPPFPQSVGQEECFRNWISSQPIQKDAPLSAHDQRIFPPCSVLHPALPDEHFSEPVLLPG